MDHMDFVAINTRDTGERLDPSRLSEYFTLNAHPSTALWRRPRSDTIATAPMVLTHLRHPFVVAEVTIMADFEREWDQGGLVIFSGPSPRLSFPSAAQRRCACSRCTLPETSNEQGRWVKAGLELTTNALHVISATASKDSGTDWSLTPLTLALRESHLGYHRSGVHQRSLRIKLERVGDGLWVWYKDHDLLGLQSCQPHSLSPEASSQGWRKVREVMGFFTGIASKENVWVGCYASRPTASETDDQNGLYHPRTEELVVEFEDFEIL